MEGKNTGAWKSGNEDFHGGEEDGIKEVEAGVMVGRGIG